MRLRRWAVSNSFCSHFRYVHRTGFSTDAAALCYDCPLQATEPAVCVPLARGVRTIALFGDHKQLPPTVICREAELAGLGVSLFDRLVSAGACEPLLLDTQYRMHPVLAHHPSQVFYGGLLRSGTRASARLPPPGFPWPNPAIGLAFLNVDSPGTCALGLLLLGGPQDMA